jgi:hypothetical protein
MENILETMTVCKFCEIPETIPADASFDQATDLRRRWCSISADNLRTALLLAGFGVKHFDQVYDFVREHISTLCPDSLGYDDFVNELESLVIGAAEISKSFFVEQA